MTTQVTDIAARLALAAVLVTGLSVSQTVRAAIDTSATLDWNTFSFSCTSGCTLSRSAKSDTASATVGPTSDGPNTQSDWTGGSATTSAPNGAAIAFVPIPAPVWLFGSALLALGFIGRRKPWAGRGFKKANVG